MRLELPLCAIAAGCAAAAFAGVGPHTGAASVAVLGIALLLFIRRRLQWRRLEERSYQKEQERLIMWAAQQLEERDPSTFLKLLDDVICTFWKEAKLREEGVTGNKAKTVEWRLRVLVAVLETPFVSRAMRRGNWEWANEWGHGSTDPQRALQRFTTVFPTILTASVLSNAKGPDSMSYLANWCSDFLEQPSVVSFLKVRNSNSPASAEEPSIMEASRPPDNLVQGYSDSVLSSWTSCCTGLRRRGGVEIQQRQAAQAAFEHEGTDLRRRTQKGQTHCWDDVDPTVMLIRGPRYFEDRVKQLSDQSVMELVGVDMFHVQEPLVHYATSKRAGPMIRRLRARGDDRFLFVQNWLCGVAQITVVWALPKEAASPQHRLFQRFCHMEDEQRNDRLKLIPRVLEAPWALKRSLPETPSLIGHKLPISYFGSDSYLEASINVISTPLGRQFVAAFLAGTKHFSIEIYILIEGQLPDELPERVLGGFTIFRVDMERLPTR